MMIHDLLVAVALLLIIEGMLPFLTPGGMRRAMLWIAELSDSSLRFIGLTSMVGGCLLLYLATLGR